jgi:hypothetical protein
MELTTPQWGSWASRSSNKVKAAQLKDDLSEARGHWALVHTTEVKYQNVEPSFSPFLIDAQLLCGEDYLCPLLFKVMDFHARKPHTYMCEIKTNLVELLLAARGTRFQLLRKSKNKDKKTTTTTDAKNNKKKSRATPAGELSLRLKMFCDARLVEHDDVLFTRLNAFTQKAFSAASQQAAGDADDPYTTKSIPAMLTHSSALIIAGGGSGSKKNRKQSRAHHRRASLSFPLSIGIAQGGEVNGVEGYDDQLLTHAPRQRRDSLATVAAQVAHHEGKSSDLNTSTESVRASRRSSVGNAAVGRRNSLVHKQQAKKMRHARRSSINLHGLQSLRVAMLASASEKR